MMKVFAVIIFAILAGCEYHNITYEKPTIETYIPLKDNYLPLAVGNYWDFETPNPARSQSSMQIHREVTSIATINNHQYYLLVTTLTTNNYTYNDSSYYRIDNNGFVYLSQVTS